MENKKEDWKKELRRKSQEYVKKHGLVKMTPDLGAKAGWRLGFFEGVEFVINQIEQGK